MIITFCLNEQQYTKQNILEWPREPLDLVQDSNPERPKYERTLPLSGRNSMQMLCQTELSERVQTYSTQNTEMGCILKTCTSTQTCCSTRTAEAVCCCSRF